MSAIPESTIDAMRQILGDRLAKEQAVYLTFASARSLVEAMLAAAPQPPDHVGGAAEMAGLEASVGTISRLVDDMRALLVDVERECGADDFGVKFEDGDSQIIDRVREMLSMLAQPPVSHAKPENQAEPNNGGACVSQPVATAWMHGGKIVNAFPWPPTDKRSSDEDKYWRDKGFSSEPLYTGPQPTKREPLTDKQIEKLAQESAKDANGAVIWSRLFARAIERAHGIGGEA